MRNRVNPFQMISEFQKFAKQMTPQEAEKKVRELVQSGQINKEMFEEIKQQAQALQSLLRR